MHNDHGKKHDAGGKQPDPQPGGTVVAEKPEAAPIADTQTPTLLMSKKQRDAGIKREIADIDVEIADLEAEVSAKKARQAKLRAQLKAE